MAKEGINNKKTYFKTYFNLEIRKRLVDVKYEVYIYKGMERGLWYGETEALKCGYIEKLKE